MSEQNTRPPVDPFIAETAARYERAKAVMDAEGIQVKHFVPTLTTPDGVLTTRYGGLSVAFRRYDRYVQVATAVCSEDDEFNGKIGAVLAVERLKQGQFILVPQAGLEPVDVVKGMFAGLLDFEDGFDDEFLDDEFDGFDGLPQGLLVVTVRRTERDEEVEPSLASLRERFAEGFPGQFQVPSFLKSGISAENLGSLLNRDFDGVPPALKGLAATLASRLQAMGNRPSGS